MQTRIDTGASHRKGWAYALTALVISVTGAIWLQLSIWTLVLVVLLLACPIVIVWAYYLSCRPLPIPLGPVPLTHGQTRYFNWIAPWYDAYCRAFGLDERFRERTLILAGLRAGDHVLDVGCGNGVLTRRIAKKVGAKGKAFGIDAAPDMIRVAMQKSTGEANAPAFKLAAMEALPFADAMFDAVILSLVLHHLPPISQPVGLKEINRVLKPGGRLLVVGPAQPVGPLLRALCRPLLLFPGMREHLEGRTSDFLRAAAFIDIAPVGRWGRWLTFWSARKKLSETTAAV